MFFKIYFIAVHNVDLPQIIVDQLKGRFQHASGSVHVSLHFTCTCKLSLYIFDTTHYVPLQAAAQKVQEVRDITRIGRIGW